MDFDLGAFRWHVGLVYKWSEGMIIDMNSWVFFLYKPGKHCNLYLSPPFSAFPLLCFHTPKDVLYRNYEFKAAGAQLVIKGTHGVNFLFRNLI